MIEGHAFSDADDAPRAHGRPTKYKPEYAEEARTMCERGATNADLAIHFGVALSTIWVWQTTNKDFFESCKLGKDVANERVKQSFFMRATGYDYHAEKIMSYEGQVIRAGYMEHVPPDTAAARFWLVNRCPDEFREKQLLEHDVPPDSPIRMLAQQISGNAIRPRLPEPKIIEHAANEPRAIRPQQHSAPNVSTPDEIEFDNAPVARAPVVTRDVTDDEGEPRIHTVSRETYEEED
jgi:hypothetical protein